LNIKGNLIFKKYKILLVLVRNLAYNSCYQSLRN